MEQRERVVDTAGTPTPRRWLEQEGDGPPIVLLHGIPTSPRLWRHVMPLLPGHRVLAPEMVGYGDSAAQGRGRDISVAAQAGYLLDWLEALEIDRAVLVGHDLGGGVAQIAAVRRPRACAGLVLTNAISFDSWPILRVRAMQKVPPLVRRLPDAAVRLSLASLIGAGHDSRPQAREAFGVHWPPYARAGAAATLTRQVTALDVRDTLHVSPRLTELDVPARVVWGDGDRFQQVAYGERLADVLRTSVHRIPDAKHFTPEDHPEVIAAAAREVHGAA